MSGFRKLNMMDFTKLIPEREKKIEAAPANKLPELKTYKANQLAAALHPKNQKLIINDVIELNASAKLYVLVPDKEEGTLNTAYFSAGQYLSISFKIGSVITSRPYTICSSPAEALKGVYKILVKKAAEGFVSDYILKSWKKGTKVTASQPLGNFSYEPLRDAKQVIGIAGGSGISLFYSMAQAICDGSEDFSLTILYGSRREEDILLKGELETLASKCDRIKLVHILSDEKKAGYESGYISSDLIKKYAGNQPYSLFVCGPKAMYEYIQKQVELLGLKKKFVRFELSGLYGKAEKYPSFPKEKEGTYKLTIYQSGESITTDCSTASTLLAAIDKAGICAPARCRSGECGWCRSRLIEGDVFIPEESDGRRLADAQFGYIHPCAAFPVSDVIIEIPSSN